MAVELKTKDKAGQDTGTLAIDEAAFGGFVRKRLLHAAAVMYHANLRQGTHSAKTRGEVAGSTKKLYRQKGTGRPRVGSAKSGKRVGGGVIHPPKPRDHRTTMPRKARHVAVRSAILSKAKDGELHVVSGLDFEAPKTRQMSAFLEALQLGTDSVLVATDGIKRNVYLSGRNLPGVKVLPASDLNTRDVLVHKHLVIDRAALERLSQPRARRARAGKAGEVGAGEVKADEVKA